LAAISLSLDLSEINNVKKRNTAISLKLSSFRIFLWQTLLLSSMLLFVINPSAQAQTARQWWVYLSPNESKELYQSPRFFRIKADADSLYLNKINSPRACLKSGKAYEVELRKALEVLSATYMGLKWGKYGGSFNPELTPYLNRLVSNWEDIISTGPVSLWTDSFGANDAPGTGCIGTVGWQEGDIALRAWIVGALPSYDAIRDDITQTQRDTIDAWFRSMAGKLFNEQGFLLRHNRGASKSAQAHVMALVLQDRALFTSFYLDPAQGMSTVLQNFNYASISVCPFPYRPGLSFEHYYKTGVYGRQSTKHIFQSLLVISHASRTGGAPSWDLARTPDKILLSSILDTWFSYGTDMRRQYIAYSNCLETNWLGYIQTKDSDLQEDFWMNFAYLQPRFLDISYWDLNSTVATIWKERSLLLNKLQKN
jgi:hypothetical protein